MSMIEQVAYICGLNVVETTTGRNGYPQNIKKAIIGFNYDEWKYAESIADKYGLRITTLHKRDGWQLWERNGDTTIEPLKPTEEWYGDNYRLYEGEDTDTWFEDVVKPHLDNMMNWADLEDYFEEAKQVYEKIMLADDTEWVVTRDDLYYETISKESMSWSHDTHNYVIALMED